MRITPTGSHRNTNETVACLSSLILSFFSFSLLWVSPHHTQISTFWTPSLFRGAFRLTARMSHCRLAAATHWLIFFFAVMVLFFCPRLTARRCSANWAGTQCERPAPRSSRSDSTSGGESREAPGSSVPWMNRWSNLSLSLTPNLPCGGNLAGLLISSVSWLHKRKFITLPLP